MTTIYLHRITEIHVSQPDGFDPDANGPGFRVQRFRFTDDIGHVFEVSAFLNDPAATPAPASTLTDIPAGAPPEAR